ncbi:hypothetical protein GK047_11090 [Paenibacillus sp. SYP-B3998]|uniref:Uncharacterized protein n=1 Tax=Paenibacillus sp. SYP-B3998 TaxID=2678564 RepID=A0A6G3ZYS8_9BACL|nr:hypothetical protein [Paenibacillus sp. SYP-B3998]NEW06557.1 hypothetical protein [Paenibacillus sp. SYP-B3998]
MMKYGAEHVEHRFTLSYKESEPRGQWQDIYLAIQMESGQSLPEDLLDPSVLVITNKAGEIVQIVLQDEGCDCEFQFTLSEKAQVESFVEQL